jgi:hypothetical protein
MNAANAKFAGKEYCVGAGIMIVAAIVEATPGVNAERKSLESIAPPPSSALGEGGRT